MYRFLRAPFSRRALRELAYVWASLPLAVFGVVVVYGMVAPIVPPSRLARYKATLDAGGDPATVAAWDRHQRLEGCSALIVVMTPHAAASTWVREEVAWAQQHDKPILPLLLDGHVFFGLKTLHYEDVMGGRQLAVLGWPTRAYRAAGPAGNHGRHRSRWVHRGRIGRSR